jgi:O-antigen/teichoic acid export membrane protein
LKGLIVPAFSKHEMIVQLKFGIPQIFIGLGTYTLDWIDRLFINEFCSLSDVGIYSLGYKIGSIINVLFVSAFAQIWAPMRMQYRSASDLDELTKLVVTYYFIIGLTMVVLVSVFSKEIMHFISGREEYIDAYTVVPFVILGYLVYGAVNIVDAGIFYSRKVIYNVYIYWFCIAANVLINYIFVPVYGYMAAAVSSLFAYTMAVFIVFYISNSLHKLYIETDRLIKLFGCTVLILILSNINLHHSFPVVAYKLVLIFFYFIYVYGCVLSTREKRKIVTFIDSCRQTFLL